MKAALFYAPHSPMRIETIAVAKPVGREVLVKTAASGVSCAAVGLSLPWSLRCLLAFDAAGPAAARIRSEPRPAREASRSSPLPGA